MSTIDVLYKCRCLAEEVVVKVPHRQPEEDIAAWFELCLTPSLYLDHRQRSPNCQSVEMEYVKVPMHESTEILGGRPKVN